MQLACRSKYEDGRGADESPERRLCFSTQTLRSHDCRAPPPPRARTPPRAQRPLKLTRRGARGLATLAGSKTSGSRVQLQPKICCRDLLPGGSSPETHRRIGRRSGAGESPGSPPALAWHQPGGGSIRGAPFKREACLWQLQTAAEALVQTLPPAHPIWEVSKGGEGLFPSKQAPRKGDMSTRRPFLYCTWPCAGL